MLLDVLGNLEICLGSKKFSEWCPLRTLVQVRLAFENRILVLLRAFLNCHQRWMRFVLNLAEGLLRIRNGVSHLLSCLEGWIFLFAPLALRVRELLDTLGGAFPNQRAKYFSGTGGAPLHNIFPTYFLPHVLRRKFSALLEFRPSLQRVLPKASRGVTLIGEPIPLLFIGLSFLGSSARFHTQPIGPAFVNSLDSQLWKMLRRFQSEIVAVAIRDSSMVLAVVTLLSLVVVLLLATTICMETLGSLHILRILLA